MCNSLCKINVSLRSRFFILRFDPLPEPILKNRLNNIAPFTTQPGRFDIRLRRSDLRYFLLNPSDTQKATRWLCNALNMHPSERRQFWKKTYNDISLQIFGCYMLTLSLLTNKGFSKWGSWIETCDPNLILWISEETAVEKMENMWLDIYGDKA